MGEGEGGAAYLHVGMLASPSPISEGEPSWAHIFPPSPPSPLAHSEALLRTLEGPRGTPIRPRYSWTKKDGVLSDAPDVSATTASYRHYKQLEIAGDIKEVRGEGLLVTDW